MRKRKMPRLTTENTNLPRTLAPESWKYLRERTRGSLLVTCVEGVTTKEALRRGYNLSKGGCDTTVILPITAMGTKSFREFSKGCMARVTIFGTRIKLAGSRHGSVLPTIGVLFDGREHVSHLVEVLE